MNFKHCVALTGLQDNDFLCIELCGVLTSV